MYKNFVSLQYIVDRVLRSPKMDTLSFDIAIDYAIECIRRLGILESFRNKIEQVVITNNRGQMPADVITVDSIRKLSDGGKNRVRIDKQINSYSDVSQNKDEYDIRGNFIFTPFTSGKLEINYTGLYLDTDGLPLILDNVDIISAIEWFIRKEHYMNLLVDDKIKPFLLEKAEQQYCWHVGRAQNSNRLNNLDDRKAISHTLTSMFVRPFNESLKNTRG